MVNNCKKLRCAYFHDTFQPLSLSLTHTHNLQQLYIYSPYNDVADDFMSSVSAHGGLVHVAKTLTVEGITFLVWNSPKLKTLHLYCVKGVSFMDEMNINAVQRKIFCNGKRLIINDQLRVTSAVIFWDAMSRHTLRDIQGTDIFQIWFYIHCNSSNDFEYCMIRIF